MLGIGANNRDGPDAIAWKQSQEFEAVLARLNKGKSRELTSVTEGGGGDGVVADQSVGPSGSRLSERDEKRKQKEERRAERRKRKEERRRLKGGEEQVADASEGESSTTKTGATSTILTKSPLPHRMA